LTLAVRGIFEPPFWYQVTTGGGLLPTTEHISFVMRPSDSGSSEGRISTAKGPAIENKRFDENLNL
jgi:hypothetical protein